MYVKQTCVVGLAGKYRLRGLHTCEIKKSVHQIVQEAKITLPLSVLKQNKEKLERVKLTDEIKEGDTITIDLGYDGKNLREFTGYIKRINTKQPLEFECEDELYLLRKIIYKQSFKKATVKEVLKYLLEKLNDAHQTGIELYDKIPELTVKNFVIDNLNGVQVLQKIADESLLHSYLTNIDGKKILYCGLIYGLQRNRVKYKLNENTAKADDLKYNQSEVIKYYVTVNNFRNDGTTQSFSFGNKNDTKIDKFYIGDYTNDELKHMANADVAKGITGYRGAIETLLIPNVQPGDIAVITDKQFGREGTGYIGTVTTTFGNGARRKPEIDLSL